MRPRRRCRRPRPRPRDSLKALPIDLASGQRLGSGNRGAFTEYFRIDGKKLRDTQYALAGRGSMARGEPRQRPASSGRPSRAVRGQDTRRNVDMRIDRPQP